MAAVIENAQRLLHNRLDPISLVMITLAGEYLNKSNVAPSLPDEILKTFCRVVRDLRARVSEASSCFSIKMVLFECVGLLQIVSDFVACISVSLILC